MKQFVVIFVLGLALGLVRCGTVDCGPEPTPELKGVEAGLSTTSQAGTIPVASDLRLDLSLNVRYIAWHSLPTFSLIQTAMACSSARHSGFDNEISTITLTCDQPVRGFAAGKNILTTSADVFWKHYDNGYFSGSITFGQWLDMMNNGETTDTGGTEKMYMWRDAYDVSIAFIPEGTATVAGTYNFTFSMEMRNGTRYQVKFAPIILEAI